jgi:hypothetical protein
MEGVEGNLPDIVIKMNNAGVNEACPLCDGYADSAVGPELFLEGTSMPVSRECAQRYEPVLSKLRDLIHNEYSEVGDAGTQPILEMLKRATWPQASAGV